MKKKKKNLATIFGQLIFKSVKLPAIVLAKSIFL